MKPTLLLLGLAAEVLAVAVAPREERTTQVTRTFELPPFTDLPATHFPTRTTRRTSSTTSKRPTHHPTSSSRPTHHPTTSKRPTWTHGPKPTWAGDEIVERDVIEEEEEGGKPTHFPTKFPTHLPSWTRSTSSRRPTHHPTTSRRPPHHTTTSRRPTRTHGPKPTWAAEEIVERDVIEEEEKPTHFPTGFPTKLPTQIPTWTRHTSSRRPTHHPTSSSRPTHHPTTSRRPTRTHGPKPTWAAEEIVERSVVSGDKPDADKINIVGVTYGGTGCPQGSARSVISDDRETITLIFDKYVATVGPNVPLEDNRKNCQVNLKLNYPGGYQYSVLGVDYRGYARLDRGVEGTHKTNYYYSGETDDFALSTNFHGPTEGDFLLHDESDQVSRNWSPCGSTRGLNINSQVRVSNNRDRNASGILTNDSIDADFRQIFRIRWRRC
ncbi:hypothetical protein LOZ58_002703 [Ophidiomyces ophidiicola]|nr:hypothetical protein LOZ58_002703 [Ophidiomyces ophidiicola]